MDRSFPTATDGRTIEGQLRGLDTSEMLDVLRVKIAQHRKVQELARTTGNHMLADLVTVTRRDVRASLRYIRCQDMERLFGK